MYKKVLVPLDGSNLAECALSHLKSLIKDGSVGEVILLNIVKIDLPWAELESGHHFDLPALRKQVFTSSKNYLKKVESRLSSQRIKVTTKVIEANWPADTITEYAQKKGIKLIIMGTHGYSGMKKMLLGSVVSGVLHQSSVPVLLIRPEACRL